MEHKLNDMGTGCICKQFGCKKWKEQFKKPGEESRCPRCWTLGSLHESSEGVTVPWCFNCGLPIK